MSVVRSVVLSSIERYVTFGVTFVSTVVISRLLDPAEIGQFSLAMVVYGLAMTVKEMGVSAYLVRAADVTPRVLRTAFGISLSACLSIALILNVLAAFVGGIYASPVVEEMVRICSLNLCIVPFGAVSYALLQRQMRFAALAWAGILSSIAGAAISIGLAYAGLGARSLAWGCVALTFCSVAVTLICANAPRFFRPSLSGARELLSFGGKSSGMAIIWEISNRAPESLLGLVSDLSSVGLLSRAMGLVTNVNDLAQRGLLPVVLPHFSKILRSGEDVTKAYLHLTTIVTGFVWALFGCLISLAEPVTLLLFGERWLGIVLPMQILALQFAAGALLGFQYQLTIVKNALGRLLVSSSIMLLLRIAFIYVGSRYGVVGACVGLLAAVLCAFPVGRLIVYRHIGVTLGDYLRIAGRCLPIFLAALLGAWIGGQAGLRLQPASLIFQVLFGGLAGVLGAAMMAMATGHPGWTEGKRILARLRGAGGS